jgi:hypothetical protein
MDEPRGPPSRSEIIWSIVAAGAGVVLSVSLFRGDLTLIVGSLVAVTFATIKIRALLKKGRCLSPHFRPRPAASDRAKQAT